VSDFRQHTVELPSGRTIPVTFRRLRVTGGLLGARDGVLTECDGCASDRVQLVACGFARHGRVDCERRCPDCGRLDAGAWPEGALVHYESRLRHTLEGMAQTARRREAERLDALVDRFAQALAEGLLQPDDFAP